VTIAVLVCSLGLAAGDVWARPSADEGQAPAVTLARPQANPFEARGITFSFTNTTDVSALRGASRRTLGRMLLDMGADVDLERALGWRGTKARVQFITKVGANGTAFLQDLQGFSNIDASDTARLGEAWIEQAIGSRMRVKVGQVDANSDFARSDVNGDFINASMGFSPTIFVLPSYPNPVLSVSTFVRLAPWLEVSGGVFHGPHGEAVPETLEVEGLFLVAEGVSRWKALRHTLPGHAVVGTWFHTGRFASFLTDHAVGADGVYGVLDQTVWLANPNDPENHRALALFVQVGNADPVIAPFDRHVAGGFTWTEPFIGRPDDVFGLGSTWVRLRDWESGVPDHEMSFGPFYKWQVLEWLSLKPDLQVITRHSNRNRRLAFTCRSEVSF
jgi:porin